MPKMGKAKEERPQMPKKNTKRLHKNISQTSNKPQLSIIVHNDRSSFEKIKKLIVN
jgi:hypothetical protein